MWIDDQVLNQYTKKFHVEVFVPDSTSVVLGSGNDETKEVAVETCKQMNVPILRRYGGGGTVVLYPGCVVVSIGCWVKEQFQNSIYFERINQSVIDALALEWPSLAELGQAGISDIVFRERKVAGTSMFRSRNYLLYQASVLVNLDRELVNSVLLHPTKEPDYRRGRSHKDFLTSIVESEPRTISSQVVSGVLNKNINDVFVKNMSDQLIDPISIQMPALQSRLDRARD